jgi:glyoxylase-like metal-dependent hydrolase (beta-lactamase superfamily II)
MQAVIEPQAMGGLGAPDEPLVLGAYAVHRLPDLDAVEWPVQALLASFTDEVIDRLAPDLPPSHLDRGTRSLVLSFNIYLVIGPGCRVLIDAGVGNDKERPDRPPWHRRRGPFLDSLAAVGVSPEDVTHVINTHLHADHVGWNTRLAGGAWQPTFPKARYIAPRREFEHWDGLHRAGGKPVLHGAFADSVLPLRAAGLIDLVDLPAEPVPGFVLEPAPGHSPGMATVRLHTGAGDVIFAADAVHHTLQVGAPERSSNFCHDPDEAARTRRAFLEAAAESGEIVAPYHFPFPAFGRIARRGEGFVFEPLGSALRQRRGDTGADVGGAGF